MDIKNLTWGVKASFRSYVEGSGGTITLSNDATRSRDGAFIFTALPDGNLTIDADGKAAGATRFQGTVTFQAHGGMLNTTITELGLEVEEDGLILTAQEAPPSQNRCTIAKLSSAELGPDDVISLAAEITLDGMYQIADNYPPGTELDPVRLS